MIGDPPVNNNIVQDNLERQCRCPPPLCHCRRDQVRGQVLFQLQEASEKDLHNDRDHFIPRGKILEIFSRQHVGELLNIVLPPVQGASTLPYENLVDYISPAEACPCSTERCTGARLIFASLILTAKENQLLNFANQDEVLCDSTLNKDTTRLEALLRSWDWTQREYDAFQRLQWPWRSPYLTRRFSLGDIELPDKVTLPWIEMTDPSAQSGGQVVRTKGHFSDILKIRIHQDHFDADQNGKAFALKIFQKTLNPRLASLRFKKEFEGNNRLGNAPENIVPLFAAFKYRGEHALVFPWAEGGSLKSIWKYQFSGTENFPDWCNSNWVQEQSLGLANALVWIHCSDEHTVGQNGHAAQLHGDIKPDNILAFPTSENGNFRYTLKFADFGSSRPVGDDGTVKTEGLDDPGTYRAPEKDLKMASVSLKWDTWSLGCVLLDFITWYLSGFEKVEEFAKKRQAELHASGAFGNKGGVIDEAFFRIRWRPPIPGLQPKWKAQVKRSVTSHIKELRELGNCDTGLRNALNAIETRILLAEETKRAASTDIRDMLSPRETTNGVVIS